MNHLDQDGRILDTIWDIYSVASGICSAAKNTIKGNFKDALLDVVGVGADLAAVFVPGVPAVGSTTVKAIKTGDNIIDFAKGADRIDDVVDAGRVVNKVDDVVDAEQIINKTIKAAKSGKLRRNMGLTDGEAHHIIPVELLNKNEFVKKAVIGGFDFNGVINGVKAKSHHGPHKKYTEMVRKKINDIAASNKNCTPEEAKALLEEVANIYRNTINESF